jgi:septal ring factor EnvC (AmiA/AmiB activator)
MGKGDRIAARVGPSLLLAVAILLVVVVPGATRLDSATSDIPPVKDEQEALKRARSQADEARRRSEAFERSAVQATVEADRARDKAAAVAARIQQSEADLRAAQARIAILNVMEGRQALRLAEKREPIMRLTAGLQTMAHRPAVLALLQPGSVADTVHLRMVLADVRPVIDARTTGLREELGRMRALQANAEAARTSLGQARQTLTSQRAELAQLETRNRIASRDYRDSAAQETERALAMAEDARDIVDLMKQMEDAGTVRDALISLPGPVQRPDQPVAAMLPSVQPLLHLTKMPAYRLPVVGDIITGFGEVSDSGVRSRGLTISTTAGAAVVAPAGGRIVFAGSFRDFAEIVIIDHGGGWTSLLTQMRRLSVAVGDTVRQGDPIGVAGTDRPRVTIELRRAERPVDIAALLH